MIELENAQIESVELASETYGKYEASPLPAGYGVGLAVGGETGQVANALGVLQKLAQAIGGGQIILGLEVLEAS